LSDINDLETRSVLQCSEGHRFLIVIKLLLTLL